MQVLMLQNGDFFDHLFVAAATVLRECFAADEELRDSFVCNIATQRNCLNACMRVLECATAGNVPLWTVLFTHSVGRWKIAICGGRSLLRLKQNKMTLRVCLAPFVVAPR